MQSLERLVDERIKQVGIEGSGKVLLFLANIKEYHISTYMHSLRVGMKCADAATVLEYDKKEMLYAGLLHDIGKLAVPVDILNITQGFSDNDHAKIKIHPEYGYCMLANSFPFTAEIIVRHHRYEKKRKPYPEKLPKPLTGINIKKACSYAKLLSIIDCYDAMTTRQDDCPVEGHNPMGALIERRPGMEDIIKGLFEARILL
ncbi:MAG: HD domain-containing protein [Nanoarchaeota archaeon]